MGVDARIRRSYGIDTRALLSESVARGDARFPGKLKGDRGNISAPNNKDLTVSRFLSNYSARNKLAFGKVSTISSSFTSQRSTS